MNVNSSSVPILATGTKAQSLSKVTWRVNSRPNVTLQNARSSPVAPRTAVRNSLLKHYTNPKSQESKKLIYYFGKVKVTEGSRSSQEIEP